MPILSITISAVLAIILGIVILVWPKLLRLAIGFYLIIFGLLQLVGDAISFSP